MRFSPKAITDKLSHLIQEIAENAQQYARSPGRDFTRKRKLPVETLLTILLGMGNVSLPDELLDYFGVTLDAASAPAFVQQREKLLPEAVETLFQRFTEISSGERLEHGYRLLAMDGSDVRIPTNPSDIETYFPGSGQKPFNLIKIAALYDLLNHTYADALLQGKAVANENKLLVEMVHRSTIQTPVILIADRNFECWDTMAQLQNKGWNYIIRIKGNNKGIASGLDLPDEEEFDLQVNLSLTRKQNKKTKELLKDRNHYRYIPTCVRFDLLDSETLFYPLPFRIVRFQLDNGSFETLVTNLAPAFFPISELKRLYKMRWGIETSFRELKYTVGLRYFHGKKADFIRQEIFARLVMYNFTEYITARTVFKKQENKYFYMANFSRAVHICKELFRGRADPDCVEAVIGRYLSPIRPGRSNRRNLRQQEAVYFIYRAA